MAHWWITFITLQFGFTILVAQNKTSNSVLPLKKRDLPNAGYISSQGNPATEVTPSLSREEIYYNNWRQQHFANSGSSTSLKIRDPLSSVEERSSYDEEGRHSDEVMNLSFAKNRGHPLNVASRSGGEVLDEAMNLISVNPNNDFTPDLSSRLAKRRRIKNSHIFPSFENRGHPLSVASRSGGEVLDEQMT